jgi:hypothetical protein
LSWCVGKITGYIQSLIPSQSNRTKVVGVIVVIASKQDQFNQMMRYWVAPIDRKKFLRVRDERDLHGCEITEVIRIGDYWELRNYQMLFEMAIMIRDRKEENKP